MKQPDLFSPRKFEVRSISCEDFFYIGNGGWWVWRLNYAYPDGYRDRCVAGPYPNAESAQAAIDEDRIACK